MEARELYSRLISPSLNICLADRDGNIAYQTSGEVPQRLTPPGFESYPLCGWTGEAGWAGMIKGDDLPSEFNPESGRLVTANHKIIRYWYGLTTKSSFPMSSCTRIFKEEATT